MGARARKTMIERWGVQHALAKWKALLEEIVPSKSGPIGPSGSDHPAAH
jgi:hypothetical protein